MPPKSAKSSEIFQKFELTAVQGHPKSSILVPIESTLCNILLVINSNYGRMSYRFRDIDAFSSKIACFPHTYLFDAPSGGTPCDINVIYESTFNGLQFRRWRYGSIFIRLAVVASQNS